MNLQQVLITVCGRAGSKSVKNKNIRSFCGHPLVLYTLASAQLFARQAAHIETDIVVSSDSEQLLALAGRLPGVLPLVRPPELAGEHTAKIPAIRHAVEYCERVRGKAYNAVIDLDITSPFRTVADIAACLDRLQTEGFDVVFSVVHSRRNPYFNMVEQVRNEIRKVKASKFVTRQEAPPVFEMNASIYAYRRDALRDRLIRTPFDGTCGIHVMPETYVLDIDEESDFTVMALVANWLTRKYSGIGEVFDAVRCLDPHVKDDVSISPS